MTISGTTDAGHLAGKRILVVEDDFLISLLVQETLTDEGCEIVGPAYTMREAWDAARTPALDAVVMDINIAGEKAFGFAEDLDRRGVPFLFVSGYGQAGLPDDQPGWRVCPKPFRGEELVDMLLGQLNG